MLYFAVILADGVSSTPARCCVFKWYGYVSLSSAGSGAGLKNDGENPILQLTLIKQARHVAP
jgi:hypothetical protein